jgi:hypothetical protein
MKDVLKQSMGNIFGKKNKFSDLQMTLFYGVIVLVAIAVYIIA